MDANALRRSLRTGGYERIGRGLPSHLIRYGVPCEREASGLRVRVGCDSDGRLVAAAWTGDGWLVVADEDRVVVPLEELPRPNLPRQSDRVRVELTMPADLAERIDSYLAGTRTSRASLINRAVAEYLGKRRA